MHVHKDPVNKLLRERPDRGNIAKEMTRGKKITCYVSYEDTLREIRITLLPHHQIFPVGGNVFPHLLHHRAALPPRPAAVHTASREENQQHMSQVRTRKYWVKGSLNSCLPGTKTLSNMATINGGTDGFIYSTLVVTLSIRHNKTSRFQQALQLFISLQHTAFPETYWGKHYGTLTL